MTLALRAFANLYWTRFGGSLAGGLLVWILFGLSVVLFAWTVNRVQGRGGLAELGFRFHRNFWADVRFGLVGYALLYVVSLPLDLIALPARTKMVAGLVHQLSLSSIPAVIGVGGLLAAVLGFITGAFHEEIRFRGYYQGAGSRELTPLAGLILATIPFSLNHYFSQPDWNVAQVLATLLPGIVYGLLYHATRSLVVVMTAHTLSNWVGAYPALVDAATGSRTAALSTAFVLGVLALVLVWTRRHRDVRVLLEATSKLLAGERLFGVAAGLVIGTALLALGAMHPSASAGGLAGGLLLVFAVLSHRFRPGSYGRQIPSTLA